MNQVEHEEKIHATDATRAKRGKRAQIGFVTLPDWLKKQTHLIFYVLPFFSAKKKKNKTNKKLNTR